MRLVLLYNTAFSAICIAAMLLPYTLIGHSRGEPIFVNKSLIQISSNVTFTITVYSDSSVNRETTLCFLLFHDTRFSSRKIQYPIVELLSKGYPAQSASENLLFRCVHLNKEALSLEVSSDTSKSLLPPLSG